MKTLIGLATIGAFAAAAALAAYTPSHAQVVVESGERTIHVQATELDARRKLAQSAFPQATRDAFPERFGPSDDPGARGGGYYLFMTSEDEWRIGSYMFVPQEVIAYQGERLTLEIFGVRGGHHGNVLFGPDGKQVNVKALDGSAIEKFDVNRGELHVIQFTADEPGLYRLVCVDHLPTMAMNIHVFPR
jgi:hypothetical protein